MKNPQKLKPQKNCGECGKLTRRWSTIKGMGVLCPTCFDILKGRFV